jgi:hypothetical protein
MARLTKNLPSGGHNYYFYFEDGRGGTDWLPEGTYSGPSVIQPKPSPSPTPSPSPSSAPTPSSTPTPTPTPTPTLSPSPPSALPDLIITEIHPDTIYVNFGEPIEVRVTVTNQGSDDAGGFYVDVYKNLDTVPKLVFGDIYMHVSGLPAGASTNVVLEVTYYAAGEYKLWAQVDLDKSVDESNEGNNIYGPVSVFTSPTPSSTPSPSPTPTPSSTPSPSPTPTPSLTPTPTPTPSPIPTPSPSPPSALPDLVITDIYPDTIYGNVGEPIEVRVTVTNQGSDDAGGFYVDMYKNLDEPPAPVYGGVYMHVSSLPAGASTDVVLKGTYYVAGEYKLWAQVDLDKSVDELNEGNNIYGPVLVYISHPPQPLSPKPSPAPSPTPITTPSHTPIPTLQSDLIVDDIWIEPAEFGSDDTVKVWQRTKNIGDGDAVDTFRIMRYFDGTYISSYNRNGLTVGQSFTTYKTYTWPSDCNPHTIKVVVDTDDSIAESIEDNNELSKTFSAVSSPTPTPSSTPSPTPKPSPTPSPSSKPNLPPTLSNFSAEGQGQIGDFYITYTDPDGDAPTIKYVYIDSSAHTMTKISGDYISGAKFKYSTTLSVDEEHNFYYYFEDGHGHSVRWPASETIVIIPIPPPPPKP